MYIVDMCVFLDLTMTFSKQARDLLLLLLGRGGAGDGGHVIGEGGGVRTPEFN